jgi:hypothetical protein
MKKSRVLSLSRVKGLSQGSCCRLLWPTGLNLGSTLVAELRAGRDLSLALRALLLFLFRPAFVAELRARLDLCTALDTWDGLRTRL